MLRGGRHDLCASARRGIEKYERGEVGDAELAAGLRKLADMLDPPADSSDDAKLKDKVKRVFDAWLSEMGKERARTKLTRDREAKIVARLREGYSVEDIMRAIHNCARSEFHRGDNDRGTAYDDITLICRTGSKLEQFRDMAPAAPAAAQTAVRYKDKGW